MRSTTRKRRTGQPRSREPGVHEPRVRDRRTLGAAIARSAHDGRRRRMEAFASYVSTLPGDVDSLGGIRAAFGDDVHALFGALLEARRGPEAAGRP